MTAEVAEPKTAAVPDRSRPPGMSYTPEAVWPETLAELDRLQAAVDQGHQPWRNNPVAVARAYLLARGMTAPAMGQFRKAGTDAGSVGYTAGGVSGREDTVVDIWAGRRAAVEADEACA